MTRTVKIYGTPRSNARKNWKHKVKRSWKHQKQSDPCAPYLPRSVDLSSTFKLDNRNIRFWEERSNKRFGGTGELNWQSDWRSSVPTETELKLVKRALIERFKRIDSKFI